MNIKTVLIAIATMFFLTFSNAQAQQSPGEFVISLMKDANGLSNLSEDTREQALLNLVRRGFDIPRIGRFVLGRYWRKATPEQRAEFLEVFELAAVRTFSPLLSDVPLDNFKITRVEYKDVNTIFVFSLLEPEKNKIIKIRWRLRLEFSDQGYKIIDITAEGVSLIVTMRSEYTTYIKRNGSVADLIAILQEKLEK